MEWQQSQLDAAREELETAEQDLEQYDSGKNQAEENLNKFVNEFNGGVYFFYLYLFFGVVISSFIFFYS